MKGQQDIGPDRDEDLGGPAFERLDNRLHLVRDIVTGRPTVRCGQIVERGAVAAPAAPRADPAARLAEITGEGRQTGSRAHGFPCIGAFMQRPRNLNRNENS